jgi:Alcohol dehydrogenase transcription factor Myb/SANT-like
VNGLYIKLQLTITQTTSKIPSAFRLYFAENDTQTNTVRFAGKKNMSRKSALKLRVMELYRANQILWNPLCSGYRNHLFREKAWEKCASQLQMTTEQFKKMTTSLRSYYNRIRKSPNFRAETYAEWVQLANSFLSQLGNLVIESYDEAQFVRELQPDTDESGPALGFEFELLVFPSGKRRMTEEIAHRLMLLYKEFPVLWQPDHPQYNVEFHRNQAWRRISDWVKVSGLTPSECKKEVHQIRSRYVLRRKHMTDSEIADHNVDWFQLAHSFLDAVLFERDTNGDLVMVNVRQGQKKYKPKNVVVTKSVFLNEPEPEEEQILKCRACLTRLETSERPKFTDADLIFTLYIELIGFSPLAAGPDRICSTCEAKIEEFSQFRKQCRENEEALIAASAQKTVEVVEAHFLEIETLKADEPGHVKVAMVEKRVEDPTRIVCELCGKDFVSPYNLNTHLRNIHGIERIDVDVSNDD